MPRKGLVSFLQIREDCRLQAMFVESRKTQQNNECSILTLRATLGSYLATEYAVVFLSIVLKIRDRIPGFDPKSLLYSQIKSAQFHF